MADKNIQMKKKTADGFDHYYPITKASNVKMADETTAETKIASVDGKIGTLSSLLTTAKGSTVAAINELFTSASNGKSAIAAAITGKGVAAADSDSFAELAAKISSIPVGTRWASGTAATPSSTTTFKDVNGNNIISWGLTVSGLSFTPSTVIFYGDGAPMQFISTKLGIHSSGFYRGWASGINHYRLDGTAAYLIAGGFRLPLNISGYTAQWIAFE